MHKLLSVEFLIYAAVDRTSALCGLDRDHRLLVENGLRMRFAEEGRLNKVHIDRFIVREADVFLQIKPGTNVALFNGMMNVIISEGLQDQKYIDERTEGYEALKEMVKDYTPEVVAEICNINAEDLSALLVSVCHKSG
jgi:predicted molibdopterin-dependent oxidoreductase YjgC